MTYPRQELEIQNKRWRIGVEIEIILLDAILKSLEKVNFDKKAVVCTQDEEDLPF
jgi:hypothetical protein